MCAKTREIAPGQIVFGSAFKILIETFARSYHRAERIISELQPHVVLVLDMATVLRHVLFDRGQSEGNSLLYLKKVLAVIHTLGGLISVLVAGTYVFYETVGNGLFNPVAQGILPAVGIGIVIGLHALNASACFAVAYSLWNSKRWSRLIVLFYDGPTFLICLALVLFPLFAPTSFRPLQLFLSLCLFVLLVSGTTLVACFRPINPVSS